MKNRKLTNTWESHEKPSERDGAIEGKAGCTNYVGTICFTNAFAIHHFEFLYFPFA